MIRNIIKRLNYSNYDLASKQCSRFRNVLLSSDRCVNLPKNQHVHFNQTRYIHLSFSRDAKAFRDTENIHCYGVLQNQDIINENVYSVKSPSKSITGLEEFNNTLDRNYRDSRIDEIVRTFKDVKIYCIENNINLSDRLFDKLVDGLMDNCEYLSDEQIYELLETLVEYPPCDSFDSHNFHDVWSCLDDICCWKMDNWDIDKCFHFAGAWFRLNLGKVSDYVNEINDIMVEKSKHLTKNQVLLAFFYLNVCRKRYVDFNLEDTAAKYVKDMTADELAIIALGFFKSQSKIKIAEIVEEMMRRVIEESKTINEISLAAILKTIRLSRHGKLVEKMYEMLDKLVPEIDRLSHVACLHIILIGTNMQALHKASLLKATEKLARDIQDVTKVRLKDIERVLLALTMFDIDADQCCNFYEKAFNELHSERRMPEIATHARCVPTALQFLAIRNIYSYELMNKALDDEFITEVYGKSARSLSRDQFILDRSIDIECPDYKSNRLPHQKVYKAAKWQTEFVPSHDQYTKISAADRFFLTTVDTLEIMLKKELIHKTHVLPHFSKSDIILCRDINTNEFVVPRGFENYILGDIQVPLKEKHLKWYALIIVGWNNTLRGTSLPMGGMLMKKRQLEAIGYQAEFILWNEFMTLPQDGKINYLKNKVS